MMIDPVDAMKKTSSLLPIPDPTSLLSSLTASATATASASVTPLPTVLPPTPEQQFVGDDGKKTLWVIFVAMVIASAGFAAMSWRVPVVSVYVPVTEPKLIRSSNAVSTMSSPPSF